jgi:hypothetical protein
MSTMEWMVIIGGIAAIIWINWYFFLARTGGVERRDRSGGDPGGHHSG